MRPLPQNLPQLQALLTPAGINLVWVLPPTAWPQSPLPAWGRLLLFASAGPKVWPQLQAQFRPEADPLDQLSLRLLQGLQLPEQRILYPFSHLQPPLQQLARWSGWVAPSPLGPDLHRDYGSWFGIRGLLWANLDWPLTQYQPAWTSPCPRCPAPCAAACPAQAVVPGQPLDWAACSRYRQGGGCQLSCPARRACDLGAAYGPEQEAFHAAASLAWLQGHPLPKNSGAV